MSTLPHIPHREPADITIGHHTWLTWTRWLPNLIAAFGSREWTAVDAWRLGIFTELDFTARQAEVSVLRWMSGVPADRHMLTAGHTAGRWRILHAASERPSAAWEQQMLDTYGTVFDWPELWAARHLTPFADCTPDVFHAAWSAWAQVDRCDCGRFGANHITRTRDGRWEIGPQACRHQSGEVAEFLAAVRGVMGWGRPFTAGELLAAGVDVTVIGAKRDERSVGRGLVRLADMTPPGEPGWFLVRLGPAPTKVMSFSVVSWSMPVTITDV